MNVKHVGSVAFLAAALGMGCVTGTTTSDSTSSSSSSSSSGDVSSSSAAGSSSGGGSSSAAQTSSSAETSSSAAQTSSSAAETSSSAAQTSSSAETSSSAAGGSSSDMGTSSSGAGNSSSAAPTVGSCEEYCTTIMANCSGNNAQYDDQQFCLNACANIPEGAAPGETSGNTRSCRIYHAGAAESAPGVHCAHAGPSGAGACGSACDHYCDVVLNVCTNNNEVYANRDSCMTACALLPTDGDPTDSSGNTVQCRTWHATAGIQLGASTHCPHAAAISSTCN